MALLDFQTLVDNLVRDPEGNITAANRDEAIALAVLRYSTDKPRLLIADSAADGTNFLALPAGFQAGFSRIVELESPPDKVPPKIMDQRTWDIYKGLAGDKIMFLSAPAAGATVRTRYTAKHTLDAQSDTIPDKHREAVAAWAAALILEQLATLFSGDTSATIQSDSVDHASKSRDYAIRAATMRKRYFDDIGVDPKRNVAAGAVVNLDLGDSRGRDRITHPQGLR